MCLVNFFTNIILVILIILIGGVLPLIERKYLSLIKRRVGPKFVGYKGRLQFIADALKVFLKGCIIPRDVNKFFFLFWPSVVFSVCVFFWVNAYWNVNLVYYDIEYTFLFLAFLSIFLNIGVLLTGYFSKNKYAWLGSIRTLFLFFCLELLFGLFIVILVILTRSFNISSLSVFNEEYFLLSTLAYVINVVLILILLEVNKSPFDLTEAESELVSGYHLEYGSFFFGLFYLCEYFHLFFTSLFIIYMLVGFFN